MLITMQREASSAIAISEHCSPELNKAAGRGPTVRLPIKPGHSSDPSRTSLRHAPERRKIRYLQVSA
jgi:hypothetical protein